MKQKMIYSLAVVFMMAINVSVFAQQVDKKQGKNPYTPEQRMEIQTGQMAKSLMLDDATSQKFVTVYSNYLKDLHGVAGQCPVRMGKDGCKNMTDEEITKMIEYRFDMSQKILDLRKKYYSEFKKILTPRQIMKVYGGERRSMERMKTVCGYHRDASRHHADQHCAPARGHGHGYNCR